jgi:putative Holliday junction resolvase
VLDWKPAAFVVGRPEARRRRRAPDREAGREVRPRLAARFNLPVTFVDETLSSSEAEAQLREQHARIRAKQDVDALAAAVILQSYLDDPGIHERMVS